MIRSFLLGLSGFLCFSSWSISGQNLTDPPSIPAILLRNAGATLGEGSLYDAGNKILYWVDIEEGTLFWCDGDAVNCSSRAFGKRIGTVVPCDNEVYVAVALEDGIYLFNRNTGELRLLCNPEKGITGNRFNDGKCSPAGNFWAGTMSLHGNRYAGSLYRIKSDGSYVRMIDSVGTSNGLAWDLGRKKMYYIDTPSSQVMEYDYDLLNDTITGSRTCIQIPKELGYPDGMTMDAEGKLWIAHWSGSGVYRWDPATGKLLLRVEVPAQNVTSCAFAGDQLSTLLITTARMGCSGKDLADHPLSGGLFKVVPGVKGIPCCYFRLKH